MAFLETPRFPDAIALGAEGGPGYSTEVVTVNSGHEQRNITWQVSRARYNVASGVKTRADMDTLIAFFRAVRGRAHGFRFKDYSDFECTTSTGLLGTGVGTGLATYQLVKHYPTGALYEYRDIKKPIAATVNIYKNGVLQTLTTHYSLNATTGIITFVAAGSPTYPTASDTLTWAGEFDVPCRFDSDSMQITIPDKNASDAYFNWGDIPIVEIRV